MPRKSGSSSSSRGGSKSGRTYADNAYNRRVGRAGAPMGSAVIRSSASSSSSRCGSNSGRTYADNAYNRSIGRAGAPMGTAVVRSGCPAPRRYVDNPYNRQLGRANQVIPTRSAGCSITPSRVYVDNAHNRKLCRVGLRLGSKPETSANIFRTRFRTMRAENCDRHELVEQLRQELESHSDDPGYVQACQQAEGIVRRQEAAQDLALRRQDAMPETAVVIEPSELALGHIIGSGTFGDVHVAIWKDQFQVAAKKLRQQRISARRKQQFQSEVKVLSQLDDPTIAKFFGACMESPNLAIVMEFLPDGSLYDNLFVDEHQFSVQQKIQLLVDMFKGLTYLHQKHIVHRDVKPSNVMLAHNHQSCKLVDFGFATQRIDASRSLSTEVYNTGVGTVKYSAPEVLRGDILSFEELQAIDVYAMALVAIELLGEEEVYDGLTIEQLRKAVLSGNLDLVYGSSLDGPKDLHKLLRSCLNPKASERPSAGEMVQQLEKYRTADGESEGDMPVGKEGGVPKIEETEESIKMEADSVKSEAADADDLGWMNNLFQVAEDKEGGVPKIEEAEEPKIEETEESIKKEANFVYWDADDLGWMKNLFQVAEDRKDYTTETAETTRESS